MSTPAKRELRRILYVEDDGSIRTVGMMVLETVGGFEAIGCASGTEALAPLAAADLILLDVKMPGMDGRETLARLRALPPDGGDAGCVSHG